MLMVAYFYICYIVRKMNENTYQRPELSYPPSINDIENVQHYITVIESDLYEDAELQDELISYGEELILLSEKLRKEGIDEICDRINDLGQLALSALDFTKQDN